MMPPLSSATEAADTSIGESFAFAIARRDFTKLAELLHPQVEFRALTPRRSWEAANPEEAVGILRTWFGECDIQAVLHVDTDELAGRRRIAYRLQGERADGPFLIEQQAYYDEVAGKIGWIRILCSGFRPR